LVVKKKALFGYFVFEYEIYYILVPYWLSDDIRVFWHWMIAYSI